MVSLKKHIASSTFFLSLSAVLQKPASLYIFYLLVSHLSMHDYGVLVLLFSFTGPAIVILTLGLGDLFKSEIALARGEGDLVRVKSITYGFLKLGLLIFACSFFLTFFSKSYLESHYSVYLVQFYFLIVLFIAGQYFLNFVAGVLGGFEKFFRTSLLDMGEQLFRLVFLVLAFNFWDFGFLKIALIAYIGSKWFAAFLGIGISFRLFKQIIFSGKTRKGVFAAIIKTTGKWIIFQQVFSGSLRNVNVWLIKVFLSAEAVALYSVASKMYSFITSLLPIQTVIFPLISKRIQDKEIVSLVVRKARKYYFIVSVAIITGVWLFADIFLLKLFPQYLISSFLIKLLVFKLLVEVWGIGQEAILFARRRQRFLFFMSIYGTLQQLFLVFISLYYFGLVGFILAIILNAALSRVIIEFYIKKYLGLLKFSLKDYLSYDDYDRIIINAVLKRLIFFIKLPILLYKRTSAEEELEKQEKEEGGL